MIYNILVDADKHWGALRAEEQYLSAYMLKRILADMPIDLYVNAGDTFDAKTFVNSDAGLYAIRDMHEKADLCRLKGIPMRVLRGTYGHDYTQLEAFHPIMTDERYDFKYFNELTIEETLPGMTAMYCPDETMNFTKYVNKHFDKIVGSECINIAFLHGNFDMILPDIAMDLFSQETSTTLVYNYKDMAAHVRGPLIAGHWHDPMEHEHLFYVGSSDRWKFGEDEPKGFSIIQYDTETQMYRYERIINPFARAYKTFHVHTSLYFNNDSFIALTEAVEAELGANQKTRVRIYVTLDEMHPDTEEQINELKYHFTNERRVSFTLTNKIREIAKKEERQANIDNDAAFGFIKDKSVSVENKIQRWIKMMTGKEYPLEQIAKIVTPYTSNK